MLNVINTDCLSPSNSNLNTDSELGKIIKVKKGSFNFDSSD